MLSFQKKLIFLAAMVIALCGGVVFYYHYMTESGPIYDFNPARDTQEIMDIFHKDWYWLLASEASSPAFMIKYRTHDANPAHFGSLYIRVLRQKGKLAGFTAYFMESATEGRLLFLAVGRDFRGHGYGKILAHDAMQQLFNRGATHITLWTRVSNLPAQNIYRGIGFREKIEENDYLLFEYWP